MKRSSTKRTAAKRTAAKARPKKPARGATTKAKPKSKPKAKTPPASRRVAGGEQKSATPEKYRQAGAPWWKGLR